LTQNHNALHIRPATEKELTVLGLDYLLDRPGFRASMLRVAEYRNRIISRVLIEQFTLRYGSVDFKMAGIGNMQTEFRFRGAGYGEQVMQDALAYIREQGAHLAVLNDTTGRYFQRFGFGPVWPTYRVRLNTAQSIGLDAPSGVRVRQANYPDIPAMARLYDTYWGARVTVSRPPDLWRWRAHHTGWLVWVAVDAADTVIGYFAAPDAASDLAEIVTSRADGAVALLQAMGQMHYEAGHTSFAWLLPPDDVLLAFVRELVDLELEATYQANGGWMARLMDVSGLLEMLKPELHAQGKTFIPDFNPRTLRLDYDADTIHIVLGAQSVQLGYRDFIQVMFASLTPEALGLREGLDADGIQQLKTLFPPRIAAIAPWDVF